MGITIDQAEELIRKTKGKIFGAEFIKKDKTVRKMSCRLGVKIGVKGIVDRKTEDQKHRLLTVYDFNADRTDSRQGGFRRISLNTLRKIKISGEEYDVIQNT